MYSLLVSYVGTYQGTHVYSLLVSYVGTYQGTHVYSLLVRSALCVYLGGLCMYRGCEIIPQSVVKNSHFISQCKLI